MLESPLATLNHHVAPAPFNDRYGYTYGSNLSPQNVTLVQQQADNGYLWQLSDLNDEMRGRDGTLHSLLQQRELRVAGADWELIPPEGSGDLGTTIAKWCTARINEIQPEGDISFDFSGAVESLQGAVYQGRAGLEAVWKDDAGWYVPKSLHFLHARRFAYGTDWNLHLWDASGTATNANYPINQPSPFGTWPGIALDRFPKGKFIIHHPRVRGVYPTREGIGYVTMWWSTFKRFGVRAFLAFAEWAGAGLRTGRFATGRGPMGEFVASPADVDALQAALGAMSSSNYATFADTTMMEIKDAPNNNDVHDRLTALCNSEMSKAILGGTLGNDAGTKGARSLGEVHERNELMIARKDAKSINGTLVRDLIGPMVRFNFGDRAPVPSFRFAVDPAQDLDKTAERMWGFVDRGGQLAQTDVRNQLNFPDPTPGAEMLVPPLRARADVDAQLQAAAGCDPGDTDPKASKGSAGKSPKGDDTEEPDEKEDEDDAAEVDARPSFQG